MDHNRVGKWKIIFCLGWRGDGKLSLKLVLFTTALFDEKSEISIGPGRSDANFLRIFIGQPLEQAELDLKVLRKSNFVTVNPVALFNW